MTEFKEIKDGTACIVVTFDVPLLRQQLDHLLFLPRTEEVEGVINLLEGMLDSAEEVRG